jgi:NitT/TauT family transport system permease protein
LSEPSPSETFAPRPARRGAANVPRVLLAFSGLAGLLLAWDLAIRFGGQTLLPSPAAVGKAIAELTRHGFLFKHIVASLFRVTWGYLLAALCGVPFGIWLGWSRRSRMAAAPLLEVFRPISPLAWIPIAILWFGVGDLSAIFIIFLGAFFPVTLAAMNAVARIPEIQLNAGRNFGLSRAELLRRVIYPATIPQLLVGLRLALGIAWLVVVAAEMIAVSSGLGFLIINARNAGNRYDLVVAGMVLIGVVGLALDWAMRRLERSPSVSWGFAPAAAPVRQRSRRTAAL